MCHWILGGFLPKVTSNGEKSVPEWMVQELMEENGWKKGVENEEREERDSNNNYNNLLH